MKHIEDFSIFEQEAQIRTRTFSGAPRYPIVAEYLGLVTKSADSGSMSELTPFLKKKASDTCSPPADLSHGSAPSDKISQIHFLR